MTNAEKDWIEACEGLDLIPSEAESQILLSYRLCGDLPPVARLVLEGDEPAEEYWNWLMEELWTG